MWDYHYGSGRGDRLEQVFFKRADQSVESSYTVNYRQITVGLVTYNTEMIDNVVDSVAGTFGYGYDTIDRMVSETGPAGSVTVVYDDLDRRKQLQVSGQGLVSPHYS